MDSLRLDVWLDVSCLFRTRSEAQKACRAGKINVNGQSVTPHRELRTGDEIVISRPLGRKQRIVVRGLADKHVAKAQARELYEDLTPPPTPEEVELRRMARLARPLVRPGAGAPDKRERRQIRRMKEGDGGKG